MNKETIKQLSSMQLEIANLLEQKDGRWDSIVSAYKKAWEAIDFYNRLPQKEQIEQITFAAYFTEVIGEVSSAVMSQEEGLIAIAQDVVDRIDETKAKVRKASDALRPKVIQLGDYAGFEASQMYAVTVEMETLKFNAGLALEFARIMCDITGANGTESESYQQYNKLYNLLAKFLHKPLRGYAEDDLLSMSVDELEYVEAQIAVRERTEIMAPFYVAYLEMVRQRIAERISMMKKLLADDNLPDL